MPEPLVIDIPPAQPRLRDLTSVPIEADKRSTFFDKGWEEDRSFFCNECGNPSHKETGDQHRRGCKTCWYVTFYPDHHFSPLTSTSHM